MRYPHFFGTNEHPAKTGEELRARINAGRPSYFEWGPDDREDHFIRFRGQGYTDAQVTRFRDLAALAIGRTTQEILEGSGATGPQDKKKLDHALALLGDLQADLDALGPEGWTAIENFTWAFKNKTTVKISLPDENRDIEGNSGSRMVIAETLKALEAALQGGRDNIGGNVIAAGKKEVTPRARQRLMAWLVAAYKIAFNEIPGVTNGGPFDLITGRCLEILGLTTGDPVASEHRKLIKAGLGTVKLHEACKNSLGCQIGQGETCPFVALPRK